MIRPGNICAVSQPFTIWDPTTLERDSRDGVLRIGSAGGPVCRLSIRDTFTVLSVTVEGSEGIYGPGSNVLITVLVHESGHVGATWNTIGSGRWFAL